MPTVGTWERPANEWDYIPSRELTYPTKREKETHLQNCRPRKGYVSSQEGNILFDAAHFLEVLGFVLYQNPESFANSKVPQKCDQKYYTTWKGSGGDRHSHGALVYHGPLVG